MGDLTPKGKKLTENATQAAALALFLKYLPRCGVCGCVLDVETYDPDAYAEYEALRQHGEFVQRAKPRKCSDCKATTDAS